MLSNLMLLNRLRRAVKKIRILLSLNMNKWWRMHAMIGSSCRSQKLSFKNPPAGLLDCVIDDKGDDCEVGRSPILIQRTASDDIDRRAEVFIANFFVRFRMERQISLQLRYRRGDSLETTLSDWSRRCKFFPEKHVCLIPSVYCFSLSLCQFIKKKFGFLSEKVVVFYILYM